MAVNYQHGEQQIEVERLITPLMEAMGFHLVRIALTGEAPSLNLQVMAEPLDDSEMNVDHCADLSRAISAVLDVEDPIPGGYMLEVSSPGVERPLVRREDFCRFIGYEVRIEAVDLQNGRRRFVGRLRGMDKDQVVLTPAGTDATSENIVIPFENISRAKLVLTDELINNTLKKRKSNG